MGVLLDAPCLPWRKKEESTVYNCGRWGRVWFVHQRHLVLLALVSQVTLYTPVAIGCVQPKGAGNAEQFPHEWVLNTVCGMPSPGYTLVGPPLFSHISGVGCSWAKRLTPFAYNPQLSVYCQYKLQLLTWFIFALTLMIFEILLETAALDDSLIHLYLYCLDGPRGQTGTAGQPASQPAAVRQPNNRCNHT